MSATALADDASAIVETRPPLIPIETFAARDAMQSPRLSPDGSLIAAYYTRSDGGVIGILDPVTHQALVSRSIGKKLEYGWHRWAGPNTVLASVSQIQMVRGEETRVSRLIAMDARTGDMWMIGPMQMGPSGDDLLHVSEDGSTILLAFQRSIYDWPGVSRFDLANRKDRGSEVQHPVEGIWDWYADDAGVVRMGTGWTNRKLRITYRKGPDDKFREIARIGEDEQDKLWDVSRIVGGSDEAYVIDEADDGRRVLARYDLAQRKPIETIYRNADWDIDDAWVDDDGKPLAVGFTDVRDRRVWLDPKMATVQSQLEAALKVDEVWIGSRSRDGKRMLVTAGGDTDPGGLYYFDSTRKSLDALGFFKTGINPAHLAKPKPINYTARDGTAIAGFLTLPKGRSAKGLPLIIMPHGGPYGIRDKLQYDDEVQFLANRGYAVLQPNFRGSGGYGSAFEDKGAGQIGRTMQDDIDDAMDWAVGQGVAAKDRVCVIGSSYGGYAAMWAVIRNPERYRCAASFAGVTDWKKILKYDAKFFSRKRAVAWNEKVTGSDFDLDTVAPARRIGSLTRPLLVAHGKDDTRVPFSQFKMLSAEAKRSGVPIEELVFEDEGHGFDDPANEARWYTAVEAFLAKNNPAD